jgi:hypothetical protein
MTATRIPRTIDRYAGRARFASDLRDEVRVVLVETAFHLFEEALLMF